MISLPAAADCAYSSATRIASTWRPCTAAASRPDADGSAARPASDSRCIIAWRIHHNDARLKIRALRGIESPRGFDQPEIAFVNQIEQRHAEMTKALGVSDDHAQVRLHQSPERNLIAVLLNLMTKHLLIVARQ